MLVKKKMMFLQKKLSTVLSTIVNKSKRSKASQVKLNPEIRKWADAVYAVDNQKFIALVRWIKWEQRKGRSDQAIAETLERFLPYAKDVTNQWWPYLEKLCYKIHGQLNIQIAADDSEQFKKAERDYLQTSSFGEILQ